MNLRQQMAERLQGGDAVFVSVERHEGSVPRERGAWMAIFADEVIGTIGGGHLEFEAIARARALLKDCPSQAQIHRYALGPSLGQCCGGVVWLRFEFLNASLFIAKSSRGYWTNGQFEHKTVPVALFGGGHVGKAIVGVLGGLPFGITWVDSRDSVFPLALPANVITEHSAPVEAQVAHLVPGSLVLIMSFSHAEDLEVLCACLERHRRQADLPYIGLIGSKTKWATFRHRLIDRGFLTEELAHVTCPIGLAGISGKEPEVIAVAVAAQLLLLQTQSSRVSTS